MCKNAIPMAFKLPSSDKRPKAPLKSTRRIRKAPREKLQKRKYKRRVFKLKQDKKSKNSPILNTTQKVEFCNKSSNSPGEEAQKSQSFDCCESTRSESAISATGIESYCPNSFQLKKEHYGNLKHLLD